MTVKYLVTRQMKCHACKGSGMVPNALWELAFEEHKKREGEIGRKLSQDEGMKLFAEFWSAYGEDPDHPPQMEVECDECDGAGVLEDEVDLMSALEDCGAKFSWE